MKILVLGADGFIGRHATQTLIGAGHQVYPSTYDGSLDERYKIDLNSVEDIARVLKETTPDVVLNCAGIVDNSEKAALNVVFTENIYKAIDPVNRSVKKVIVTGSAAEYGLVNKEQLPVSESAPVHPESIYGSYKAEETKRALKLGNELGVPTIIARLFNPLGANMHPRMLLPNLMSQIREFKDGVRGALELSRLDALRDYIDVRDIAEAYRLLVEKDVDDGVYNVGSGSATPNQLLIELLLDTSGLPRTTPVHETSAEPEKLAACQADITRIRQQTGWSPVYSLKDTIEGAFHANQKERE